MNNKYQKILQGYQAFRAKYAEGDSSVMQHLADDGQQPDVMVVACCDSRVDPALILQCHPGDLFVVRNVANIVPPYEKDEMHHGTSAALEFGINFLKVKHLILLGHSQCGGIQALLANVAVKNDFISNWVSLIDNKHIHTKDADEYSKLALHQSYQNCLSFPWLKARVDDGSIKIHLWFFHIETGQIYQFDEKQQEYLALT